MTTTIEAFDFTETHEIVGYGRARLPTRGLEVQIEVLLMKADPGKLPDLMSTETPVARWIGCGQLDKAPIGSQWLHKAMVSRRDGLRRLSGNLEYKGVRQLDTEPGFSPDHGNRADHSLMIGHMRCFRLGLSQPQGALRFVYVPVLEVARALFGVSSHLLVQMFSAIRTPDMARDSAFFDRRASGMVIAADGSIDPKSFRLVCRSCPEDLEAVVAALSLTDRHVMEAHDSVRRTLTHFASPDPAVAGFPDMSFPFPNSPFRWTFEGRYVRNTSTRPALSQGAILLDAPRTAVNLFLVTRILHLEFRPSFNRLEIKVVGSKEGTEGLPSGNGHDVRDRTSDNLQIHTPPGSGRAAREETTAGADLQPAHHVEIVHLDLETGGGPGAFPLTGDRHDESLGSTGDRVPGGSRDVVHIKLRRRSVALLGPDTGTAARAASLKATFDAVDRAAGWTIVRGGRAPDGLPHMEAAVSRARSFMMLLLVVRCGSCFFAVADAGTVPDDERSLGLIRRPDRGPFVASDIERLLVCAADNAARWQGKRLPGFSMVSVARQPIGILKDVDAYRTRLVEATRRLFATPPHP